MNNFFRFSIEVKSDSSTFLTNLSKKYLILGSDPLSDIFLPDPSIFSYHFLIEVSENNVHFKNLVDHVPIILNGEKCFGNLTFSPGDEFYVAHFKFRVLYDSSGADLFSGFGSEEDVFFEDQNFKPLKSFPSFSSTLQDELIPDPSSTFFQTKMESRLQVFYLIHGNLVDTFYFDLTDREFFFDSDPKSSSELFLSHSHQVHFASVQGGSISFFFPEVFFFDPPASFDLSNGFFVSRGIEQFYFKLIPSKTDFIFSFLNSFDGRSFQLISKIFLVLFIPFSFLFFFSQESKVPKIVAEEVIYFETPEDLPNPDSSSQGAPSVKVVQSPQLQTLGDSQVVEAPTPALFNTKALSESISTSDGPSSPSDLRKDLYTQSADRKGALDVFSKTVSNQKAPSQALKISTSSLTQKNRFEMDTQIIKKQILGSIDPELLRKILGEYLSQFKFCYQGELLHNSEKVRGIVDLDFRINQEGKVIKFDLLSKDLNFSPKGRKCIEKVLSSIIFPKPKGGGVVDVRQPLNFFSDSENI
jgi:hypothetical protein